MQTITCSGRNLMAILNDILDSAKVESGALDVKLCPFDVVEVATLCVNLQGPRAQQKGLRLSADLSAAIRLRALVEPGRVQQVLNNLIGNAIKFTDASEVRLTVAPTPCRTRLEFRVSDTGIGMDHGAQQQLFKPFTQLRNGGRTPAEGTGLGLWISSELVRLMGGKLEAASTPGQGSRFSFALERTCDSSTRAIAGPCEQDAAENVAARRLRVLIVEDEPVNQLVAQARVSSLGHMPTVASSGEEALRIFEAQGFDVVLMDRHMSGIDGLETTRRIRAIAPRTAGHRASWR